LKYIELGTNASKLKDGIKFAAEKLCNFIKSNSYKVEDNNAIKNICTVSANGDKKVGKLIADVLNEIGKDGTIKVENGNTNVMTSSIVKGMVIDQSYASPYFVNSTDSMEVDLDHPYLLICNKKLSNIQELLPALQSTSSTKRPIFIIADDYSEDILATLVMNRLRGLNVCAIKSPSYGDNRKAILEDIAVLCGGRVVSDETGTRLEHAVVESGILGEAKRVLVTKENTVIFDGFGSQDKLQARADSLRK
jgi:chaperonin GroEL